MTRMRLHGILIALLWTHVACGNTGPGDPNPPDRDGGPETPKDRCSYESSCALEPGKTQSEAINEVGDEDIFDFVVDHANVILHLHIENVQPDAPARLEALLSRPNGTELVRTHGEKGIPQLDIQETAPEPGRYTLRIRAFESDKAENQPYRVTLEILRQNDVYEPNNTRKHAHELTLNAPAITAYIATVGDVDWFRFSSGPNQTLILQVTPSADSKVRLAWELFTRSETQIASSVEPPGATWQPSNIEVGSREQDYFLRVRASNNRSYDAEHPYQLEVRTAP